MYNNKIASLEYRLARLESKLAYDDQSRWLLNTLAGAIESKSNLRAIPDKKIIGNTSYMTLSEQVFRNGKSVDLKIEREPNGIKIGIYTGSLNGYPEWNQTFPAKTTDGDIALVIVKVLRNQFDMRT